jgi:hypothetical protein
MDFSGPEPADYANVEALNAAFLRLLCRGSAGEALRAQLPVELGARAAALTSADRQRLARAPFLLMSFRERDAAEDDLLAAANAASELRWLAATGLAFLWQLARRNPYAARLYSGGTLEWCERLGGITLLQLLHNVAAHPELPCLRTAGRYDVWGKLLGDGAGRSAARREAAHLAVLQAMLTSGARRGYRRLAAAACNSATPALGIAERRRR